MKIPAHQLSEELQQSLEKIQAAPNSVNFYQATSGKGWAVFGIIVFLLGMAGLIGLALNEADEELRYVFMGGAALALLILISSVNHIRAYNGARVKPFRGLNPLYYFELGWDELKYYKMWTLKDFRATHHLQNGVYQHTAFVLMFEEGNVNFQVSPKPIAEKLFNEIKATRVQLLLALENQSFQSLGAHDLFGHALGSEVSNVDEEAPKSGRMGCLASLALAVILGAGAGMGLSYLSAIAYDARDWDYMSYGDMGDEVARHVRYGYCAHQEELPDKMRAMLSDNWVRSGVDLDDEAWDGSDITDAKRGVEAYNEIFGAELALREVVVPAAKTSFQQRWNEMGTSPEPREIVEHKAAMAELVAYLNAKPYGWGLQLTDVAPHMGQIDEAIVGRIEGASQEYQSQARNVGASEEAIAAIAQIFKIMREQRRYSLVVSYEQALESDTSLEEDFKEVYPDYKYIEPMSPSFTPAKNLQRESLITEVLASAFEDMLQGLVKVSTIDSEDAAVYLTVYYAISPEFELYYNDAEEHLPDEDRHWSTAIVSDFALTFSGRDAETSFYLFETHAAPADQFSIYSGQTMYDAMASSLFDDFRAQLASHFGVY